jgi:hypothetical protein
VYTHDVRVPQNEYLAEAIMHGSERFAQTFLVLLVGSSALLRAAPINYNFDTDVIGKATSFTDTASGLGATFSSSSDPGGFVVASTFLSTLTGNVLFDPGPAGLNNLTLTILFSAPQTSISIDFATNSGLGVPLNLDAFNGASAVGSTSATGSIPANFSFPEGVITFSGPAFNMVTLSSTAADFAIDNVTVTAAPEPGSFWLLLLGVLGFSSFQVQRRSSISRSKPAQG